MKVTIAIDSLKGSLSSLEAGKAIGTGVKKAWPEAEVCVRPQTVVGGGAVGEVPGDRGRGAEADLDSIPRRARIGLAVDNGVGNEGAAAFYGDAVFVKSEKRQSLMETWPALGLAFVPT